MDTKKWLSIAGVVVVVGLAVWLMQPKKSNPTDQNQIQQQPNQTQQQPIPTVTLSSKSNMGNFLVDAKGMTLYYFAKDTVTNSNCPLGPCLTAWPVFYSADTVVPATLNKVDFSQITRDDGAKQSTYKGWPLYYYYQDTKPGDTLGEGVGNIWYIVPEPFYTVMIQNQVSIGSNYLADSKGMTLYTFTNDKQGSGSTPPQSTCTDKCLATWPVFNTASFIIPSVLKNSDFTSFKRSDGANQLAYKGWPLYYYAGDAKSGDVKGQGFNKVWFVVKP